MLTNKSDNIGKNMVQSYYDMANIVEAVQIFKYPVEGSDELDEYRLDNLTPKQSALIDALAEYGARCASNIGHTKAAERMRTQAGLNNGIVAVMKDLSPELFPRPQAQVQAQAQPPVRRRNENVI